MELALECAVSFRPYTDYFIANAGQGDGFEQTGAVPLPVALQASIIVFRVTDIMPGMVKRALKVD